MKISLLAASCLFSLITFSQNPGTIKEYKKTFTTYPFSDPSPVPMLNQVYPYFRYDGFTAKSIQREWKVVELQNDYLTLLILPEIGGKIWTAIERSTNRPFIYYNQVVKFRDIAMRGPWTSGGLEANYGIIGHTPNCATPVDYRTIKDEDGTVTCVIGALDLLTRSNWRLEIRLEKDKAFFTTQSFWYNGTPIEQPYYHWMNAGLKTSGDLEFVLPGNQFIGHDGSSSSWPINSVNGKNQAKYDQNDFGGYKSYHVFGEYADFAGAYWHKDSMGMIRYSTHDDKAGKKVWVWGQSRQGMIWEKLLTDNDGQYVELQSGRAYNQAEEGSSLTPFKQIGLFPYGTEVWKEYWYPVLKTKGIAQATEYGALNIKTEDEWLKIYFSPVQPINDTLTVFQEGTIVFKKYLALKPLQSFIDSVQLNDAKINKITASIGKARLRYNGDPAANLLARPAQATPAIDWNSSQGLYLLAKEAMNEKKFPLAEEKLLAALQLDSSNLPALVCMSELLFRNMRYEEALAIAKKILGMDTYHPAGNYYYGLINLKLNKITDAKDGFDLATLSPVYRGQAYTELIRLYFAEGNYERAGLYASRALAANIYNMEALQLQAMVCRYQGDKVQAGKILQTIDAYDKLNHFTRFEKYYQNPDHNNQVAFTSLIRNELPVETFLELAIWYYNAGCIKEAIALLDISPASAETSYWLNFLKGSVIDYTSIDKLPAFPFRSETGWVLEQLIRKDGHWLPRYHLALIYKDRNRVSEARRLLLDCGQQPTIAAFYAVRAAILEKTDQAKAEADLKNAGSLDPHWRYGRLLADFYLGSYQYEKALQVSKSYHEKDKGNYIIALLHAKSLLHNKRYNEADKVLANVLVLPFENATESRELYREAKLMQAIDHINAKKYQPALRFIREAGVWPENLGTGKPYDADIDTRLEEMLTVLSLRGKSGKAAASHSLGNIIDKTNSINAASRNIRPENVLIAAIAMEQMQGHDKALAWLNNVSDSKLSPSLFQWMKSVFERRAALPLDDQYRSPNTRILERVIQLYYDQVNQR
ncbi:DUF5107 domain-containing protein [Terrimonas sp. NA20]|uniref:DUF5107 domain-containing protein n=1 Tax=Terrimonas ginsenosidimutans TaxID=2908004 RepID=A0ABS9KT18_9BACT|nr:DUF5107 domain-containing protein [Terrimonas ginsenosidimutans]MCG2615444.1 DUF5107 domain-containing protein [Terrimonas ginsenosidimutans]